MASEKDGFIMSSIAVVKAENGHDEFGKISVVFKSSAIVAPREYTHVGQFDKESFHFPVNREVVQRKRKRFIAKSG